jgi:hypothetical protein
MVAVVTARTTTSVRDDGIYLGWPPGGLTRTDHYRLVFFFSLVICIRQLSFLYLHDEKHPFASDGPAFRERGLLHLRVISGQGHFVAGYELSLSLTVEGHGLALDRLTMRVDILRGGRRTDVIELRTDRLGT